MTGSQDNGLPPGRSIGDRLLRARLSRRQVLGGALALAGSAALSRVALGQQPPPVDTTKVPGVRPGEVGTRSPFEGAQRLNVGHTSFAPLDRLHGIITPSDLHFVVSHAGVPEIDPTAYKLLVHGMVDRPTVFTLRDLMRFPSVSLIYFIECAGNSGNGWFDPIATDTVQNLHGLTSTSEWTGVPLNTLLREVGAGKQAKWLLAESQDASIFDRSIPATKGWDDILVAYGQNGEALRPEQGYPVRLVVPGWEGSINVKWLRRIELSDRPFMTRNETATYTDVMPDGTSRQFTFKMEVKSVITWPSGGHQIPGQGFWEITGLAWSGGGKIARVEVSTDGGRTWGLARLQEPALRLAHVRFTYPWVWDGAPALLMSRATDDKGDVQPSHQALVKERGLDSLYHYHAIQTWKVERDGNVVSIHPSVAKAQTSTGFTRDSFARLAYPGCLV